MLAAALESCLRIAVGAGFETAAPLLGPACGDGVDDAVQGVAAEQRAGRSADDLDGRGLLGVDLEQVVDVAKASGADGDAVLEQQEAAAGARARQHAGADRGQMFVSGTARDPDARDAEEQFMDVACPGQLDLAGVDVRDAAGAALARRHGCLGAHHDLFEFRRRGGDCCNEGRPRDPGAHG